MIDIGKEILGIRQKKKLSQRALAERCGLPWNTIARIERGELGNPKWETLTVILKALGMEVALKRIRNGQV